MGIKILVSGRGSGVNEVSNGHHIRFVPSARCGNDIIGLEDYCCVFQHAVNSETEDSLRVWSERGWGAKVVLFSGGSVPKEYHDRGFALLEGIVSKDQLLNLHWSSVPEEFNGAADELVRLLQGEGVEFLPALAILCQGFLAVHAVQADREAEEMVKQALHRMGWDTVTHAALVQGKEKWQAVQDPGWWLDTFQLREGAELGREQWQNFLQRVESEWGRVNPEGLSRLLRGGLMRSLENGTTPPAEGVAEAYLVIVERLAGRPEAGQS